MIAEDGGDGGDAPKKIGIKKPDRRKQRKLTEGEKKKIIEYLQRQLQGMPLTLGDFRDRLISGIRSQLDDDKIIYTNQASNDTEIRRLISSYIANMRVLIDNENSDIVDALGGMNEGEGVRRINKPVAIRGRGMPTSKETVIAEAYNERELGANGGKRYVSL